MDAPESIRLAAGRDSVFYDGETRGGGGVFVLFFLLWLLMTGDITVHACLWGLVVSAAMTWFCRKFLDYRLSLPRPGRLGAGVRYLGYLLVEMLKAGFVVMRLVYTRGRNMRPVLVWFNTPLETDRTRAILADSITLTAGTITVTAADGRFCVHALDESLATGIEDSEFQRRLEKLEA